MSSKKKVLFTGAVYFIYCGSQIKLTQRNLTQIKIKLVTRKVYDHGWKYTILKLIVYDHFVKSKRST